MSQCYKRACAWFQRKCIVLYISAVLGLYLWEFMLSVFELKNMISCDWLACMCVYVCIGSIMVQGEKNLIIIVSWALPIEGLNLMCEIGMNVYQYWHQPVHF